MLRVLFLRYPMYRQNLLAGSLSISLQSELATVDIMPSCDAHTSRGDVFLELLVWQEKESEFYGMA